MNQDGMKLWWEIWMRSGALLRKPPLLVFDQFRTHLTEETKKLAAHSKIQLAVILGGLTSQLQLLDVSINKPFKNLMQKEWTKWMQDAESNLTPTGKVRMPTLGEVCSWVIKAWNGVKPEVIIKSFKCGISNAMDGTEDDAIFELSDSSGDDDEKLAGIAEELTLVDISDESDEEFNDFYDE